MEEEKKIYYPVGIGTWNGVYEFHVNWTRGLTNMEFEYVKYMSDENIKM